MKILIFIKLQLLHNYKNLISLLKFFLLFKKYLKILNLLFTLWVLPIDSKIFFELFDALVEEDNENMKEGEETAEDIKRKNMIFWIEVFLGFLGLVAIYLLYKANNIGGGVDLSGFNRVIPGESSAETTEIEPDFVSLLDEKYFINTDTDAAKTEAQASADVDSTKH